MKYISIPVVIPHLGARGLKRGTAENANITREDFRTKKKTNPNPAGSPEEGVLQRM